MPENDSINRPLILNSDEARTKEILLLQPTYILDENNFNKLIKGSQGFKDWSQKILFMSLGWVFKIVSAFIVFLIAFNTQQSKKNIEIGIEVWECVSVCLAFLVCLILYLLGFFIKNERDKLIDSIKKHFNKNKN